MCIVLICMASLCPPKRTHCAGNTKYYVEGSTKRQFRRSDFKQIIAEK